ncbi:hypothetical protein BC629DRAFT_1536098 [Irpex lacteus]|nr:hypothetical protein BC629DRAFT_1536098 [Irpex lacteus]
MMLTSPLSTTALSTSRSESCLVNGSLATRRVAHLCNFRRHQTTNARNGPIIGNTSRQGGGSVGSHLAAAFGGGVVVLLAAYGYYHFSGAKKAVDSARAAQARFRETKTNIVEKAQMKKQQLLNAVSRGDEIPKEVDVDIDDQEALAELSKNKLDNAKHLAQEASRELLGALRARAKERKVSGAEPDADETGSRSNSS